MGVTKPIAPRLTASNCAEGTLKVHPLKFAARVRVPICHLERSTEILSH